MANKFVIEVVAKGFKNLESQLGRADAATKGYEKAAGRARGTTSGLRREIGALRNNILLYTFAIGSAARVTSGFLRAASDAQENLSKFKVVFGDASQEALSFANTLASSFQRSNSEIISLLASLQDTFVPLGFSRDRARQLSQALTELSFDIGSFNNVASPEVAHALTSAIVGNHEAVRRFGIVLTEAQLQQEAFRVGITNSNRQLTAQEKVLSRVSLIISSTKDAQGDLLRTQDEFANRVRALTSEFRNLQEEIGRFLIPFAETGLGFLQIERIKAYAASIAVVGTAYAVTRVKALKFTTSLKAAELAVTRSKFALFALVVGQLGTEYLLSKQKVDDFSVSQEEVNDLMKDLGVITEKSNQSLTDFQKTLKSILLGESSLEGIVQSRLAEKFSKTVLPKPERPDAILPLSAAEKAKQKLRELNDEAELFREFLDIGIVDNNKFVLEEMEKSAERSKQFFTELMEAMDQGSEDLKNKTAENLQQTIDNLSKPFEEFSRVLSNAILQTDDLGKAFEKTFEILKAQIIAKAAEIAILQALGVPSGGGGGGGFFARLFTGHTGGSISKKGIQTFNQGGQVRGRDDVPILAQAGEYIIKRDSAESIGLDALNEINETGRVSSFNINFNAPVTNADFVRDVVAPELQKVINGSLA
jgi:hypothetical protein